ncbi:hypothetical protein AGR4A_Cc80269 [Agrobacterium tumefaciens str. B6]|uniref:Uncharacterized protein n=1 Tax=Agrobacterium tumefaciens str. B6 TaxID=1183423 RepID=A0A822V1R5_AGRTU|nr:hypothetical protein AGR4A_Cc80269 [Agrobacterium tumefaciens str. B6]
MARGGRECGRARQRTRRRGNHQGRPETVLSRLRVCQGKVEPGFPEKTNKTKESRVCQVENEPDRL